MGKTKKGGFGDPFFFDDADRKKKPSYDWEQDQDWENNTSLLEGLDESDETIADAHEALSKLYNKTHKRQPRPKTSRRREAWE